MARAQALNRSDLTSMEGEHISELRSPQEMGKEHGGKVLDLEAGKIRHELLERVNKEKGVISDDEKEMWQRKLYEAYQDTSRLRAIKEEFEDHWRRSLEMHRKFDTQVHGAEDEGMLKEHEHEELDARFTQSGLAQKEKMVQELEKELESRHRELGRFLKVEKAVQQKRRKELDSAENYDEKLKTIEEAEHENEHLQEFKGIFDQHSDAIGTKTRTEYYEWFLTLSHNDQHKAIDKAEKEDIAPRVEAFQVHAKLPKEYQAAEFKNWGLSQRLNYLGDIERKLEREWGSNLQEAKSTLAEKSIRVIDREYAKPNTDMSQRLGRKINFKDMLKKQVDQEKKLWKEFEKLPDQIHGWLKKEFTEGDFEERTALLRTQGTKLLERYTKALNGMNNKIDKNVSELYREQFDSAKSIDDMETTLKEAKEFQSSKNRYFKKFRANAKYFHSDIKVYEDWYNETVRSVGDAKHWELELDGLIVDHKKVYDTVAKLPPFLKERMDMDAPFDERRTQAEELAKTHQAYKSTIPFLLKNAEAQEAAGDMDTAFKFYIEALKLDPDSDELKQLAARAKQQGGSATRTSVSEEDEARTQEILKQVESSATISAEAAELARQRILLDLAKKHAEHVGATGTTSEARAKASLKSLNNEDRETAEAVMKDHGDDYTVDEKGTLRQKIKVHADGTRTQTVEDQLGALFDNKVHKGEAAQSGFAEVAFVDTSGREVERSVAEKQTEGLHDRLEDKLKALAMGRIKAANLKLSDKQLKGIEAALNFHERTEELEEDAREAA